MISREPDDGSPAGCEKKNAAGLARRRLVRGLGCGLSSGGPPLRSGCGWRVLMRPSLTVGLRLAGVDAALPYGRAAAGGC